MRHCETKKLYDRQITFFIPFSQKETGRFGNVSAIIYCRKLQEYYWKEKKLETFIKYKWEVEQTKFDSYCHYPNVALCYRHTKDIPGKITRKDEVKSEKMLKKVCDFKNGYEDHPLKRLLVDNFNDIQSDRFFLGSNNGR